MVTHVSCSSWTRKVFKFLFPSKNLLFNIAGYVNNSTQYSAAGKRFTADFLFGTQQNYMCAINMQGITDSPTEVNDSLFFSYLKSKLIRRLKQ
jgi:hypothetical protein